MNAEFTVYTCYVLSGLGLVLSGEVKSGTVAEGEIGMTAKGKRCTVVKIETKGERMHSANSRERVTLVVKHISKDDVKPWDTLYFK